ncbi:MAG: Mut7-C ubiquitin/RNAse domain-containing protein [Proteobacteria bacterium]|nr:Mut7-C ubiquitin/RNAse domain-containing protein [Desulfobacterales bacterium]MBL6968106.1 Mut7-C ubiquitin/RNAse domain-containing protein [Desulfobacteraceae bacterium]MBL7173238.1 Mut7-C ubiquitin/RNAse domain-containing protein [Desulfobacteraceae bacterium]MBU0733833.1 Mut7-C ubiquitin/RNAse domain-containing protein [Pseudomonadota bacterium]MBU1905173.1 Mut7-C ubiquitin/RNAse domain-containing protein [Pseudomonadota bacterium]
MPTAIFRFYEELNDFVPPERRKRDFEAEFKGRESVKDRIEALGVPHTEVDLILVNGESVDFGYVLQDGDRISVYPVFESLDIRDVTHLREIPLRETRFIADINIRDIVRYMRVLGLDVYYDPSLSPRDIIRISKREKRTILTKSRNLLKFRDVTHGMFIRPGTTVEQIKGIIDFLSLREVITPFSRCLQCNNSLVRVSKESVFDRIPPKTRAFCNEYSYCNGCDRIYWKGTHFDRIKKVIGEILGMEKFQDA